MQPIRGGDGLHNNVTELPFFITNGYLLIAQVLNYFFTSQVLFSTSKQRVKVLFWSARSLFYESILVSFLGFSLNFQCYRHCLGFTLKLGSDCTNFINFSGFLITLKFSNPFNKWDFFIVFRFAEVVFA